MLADISSSIGCLQLEEDFFRQMTLRGPNKPALILGTLSDLHPWSLGRFRVEQRDWTLDEVIVDRLVLDHQRPCLSAFTSQSTQDPGTGHGRIYMDPGVGRITRHWTFRSQTVASDDHHTKTKQTFGLDFDVKGTLAIGIDSPAIPSSSLIQRTPKLDTCNRSTRIVDDCIIEFERLAG